MFSAPEHSDDSARTAAWKCSRVATAWARATTSVEFFPRERQPAFELRVQLLLVTQVHADMEERTTTERSSGRSAHVLARCDARAHSRVEIRAPDIATVDDPSREDRLWRATPSGRRPAVLARVRDRRGVHQSASGGQRQIIAQPTEIRCDEQSAVPGTLPQRAHRPFDKPAWLPA